MQILKPELPATGPHAPGSILAEFREICSVPGAELRLAMFKSSASPDPFLWPFGFKMSPFPYPDLG